MINSLKFTYRLIIFFTILIWVLGFSFECFINISPSLLSYYPFIKETYSLVCHQNPKKTIELSFGKLLVCSRCSGIYIGAFIMSFISLFTKKYPIIKNKLLYLSASLLFLDVLLTTINFYNYSKLIAFLTGLFFGSLLFFYFLIIQN